MRILTKGGRRTSHGSAKMIPYGFRRFLILCVTGIIVWGWCPTVSAMAGSQTVSATAGGQTVSATAGSQTVSAMTENVSGLSGTAAQIGTAAENTASGNRTTIPMSAARGLFPDVPANHWAAEEIRLCVECGFLTPAVDGSFGVGKTVGRGAFLEILSRFFAWPSDTSVTLPYRDVSAGSPYASVIARAFEYGVITEQSTLFRPGDPITREELAVMLVRALGYRAISGLADPYPFADVTTNSGYITMAHDLGLVNGNQGAFMPENPATREQTAVILARLWRKLYATVPARIGIVSSLQGAWVRSGLETAAIRGGTLSAGTKSVLTWSMDRVSAENIRDEVRRRGMSALLYVRGDTLYGNAPDVLAEAARGYDGLMLELDGESIDAGQFRKLKNALGGGMLLFVVPPPRETVSYPYETLAESADLLVIRMESDARLVDHFPVDPVDPLEDVYDALRTLKRRVGERKLAFMLTTSARLWSGGQTSEILSGQDVETMVRLRNPSLYYSERYACAYFRIPADGRQMEQVCWYLDTRAVTARMRLAQLFDIGGIVLSDADGASTTVRDVLDAQGS